MKLSVILLLGLLSTGLIGNVSGPAAPGKKAKKAVVYTIVPQQSTLTWNAKKVGGEHTGTIALEKGMLTLDDNKLVGGEFTANMTTIKDVDLTNEAMNAKLTNHLKSDDFFSAEKHPTSTFRITKATAIAGANAGEANYTVTGDLTIKGITKPQTFPATVSLTGSQATATAKVMVDRLPYDIKYRAAIIGTAADRIIDDQFTFDVKLVAQRAVSN